MKNQITSFKGEYRFLSNFWPVSIFYEGLMYPSVEHAYQAQKTEFQEIRQKIANFEKPGDAKKFGEELKLLNQIRIDWDDNLKLDTMKFLVLQKFLENDELQEKLMLTGTAKLIEGNDWNDTFWGVCEGKGENHLGKILMEVRYNISSW